MGSRLVAPAAALLAAVLLVLTPLTGADDRARPSGLPPGSTAAALSAPLAPEVASYRMQATLSPDGKSLEGSAQVRYRNPSPDTLRELYLHLYLNAFRAPDTVWMREARLQHRGFAFDPAASGWISVHSISTGDQSLALELEADGTVARVPLPRPLAPGETLTLATTWSAQLPRVFARTGWAPGGFTMVGQWYPKLAVYDPRHGGWDREPWHANAEFFHDFGSYTLALTVPAQRRTVVATGEPEGPPHDNGDGTATWRFHATSVTDVAWMAAERFVVRSEPRAGITLDVALPAGHASAAPRYLDVAEYALRRFGEWLVPYPWPRLAIVVPPDSAGGAGGMEYPMLVTSLLALPVPGGGIHDVEAVTVHEIAHQWFPMQVASDEARAPFLDEGFADYLTLRLLAERYGADRSLLDLPFARLSYLSLARARLPMVARTPVTKPAWEYTGLNQYAAAVYAKASLFLTTLERAYGSERFLAALRGYVEEWRWRHPTPADFHAAMVARLDRPETTAEGGPGGVAAWLDQLAFGERTLGIRVDLDAAPPTARRVGDATLPLDGVLWLQSGPAIPWRLDAGATALALSPPAGDRIAVADGDPEDKLLIEVNRLDDRHLAQPQYAALAGVLARLVELLALLFQSMGQFG